MSCAACSASGAMSGVPEIARRGILLLGCGRMGSALLDGWLTGGLPPGAVTVLDPAPSPAVETLVHHGLRLNAAPDAPPGVCLLAVKPQVMDAALPRVAAYGGGPTLFVSIAAGIPVARLEAGLGAGTPVVRAMPNTPAAIGRGITALVGNAAAGEAHLAAAEELLAAVGETARLPNESLMDAVTAVSGSGPAYAFLLIEALAAAGEHEGLPRDLALRLARATVAGAGALAAGSEEDPATLRENVTSPGGTTAAALEVLMAAGGLPDLIDRAVAAAARRSRELAG
jgi:pyrroline-5-carboxylate reductase